MRQAPASASAADRTALVTGQQQAPALPASCAGRAAPAYPAHRELFLASALSRDAREVRPRTVLNDSGPPADKSTPPA